MSSSDRVVLPRRIFKVGNEPDSSLRLINRYGSEKKLVKKVRDSLGNDFKKLQESFLGPIIEFAEQSGINFSRNLVHYLLVRRICWTNDGQLWFTFGEQLMRFSLREFVLTTGLPCEDDVVVPQRKEEMKNNDSWMEGKKKLGDLIEALEVKDKQLSSNERIRLGGLILVEGILIANNPLTLIPKKNLERARDFEEFCSYPWARIAYESLVDSVESLDQEKLSRAQYGLSGFAIAIQIWMLSSVDKLGERFGTRGMSKDLPLCLQWKKTRSPTMEEVTHIAETYKHNIKCIIGDPNLHCNLVSKVTFVELKKLIDIVDKGYRLERADWVNGYIAVPFASRQIGNVFSQSRRNENQLVDSKTAPREVSCEALRSSAMNHQDYNQRLDKVCINMQRMDDSLSKIEEKLTHIYSGIEANFCLDVYSRNTSCTVKEARLCLINGPERDIWTCSLSTRGWLSIGVGALKLLKNPSTWTMGELVVPEMPHLSTRLEKRLTSIKLNRACGPSSTHSKILENSETSYASNTLGIRLIPGCADSLASEDVPVRKIKTEEIDLEGELKRLSLTSDRTSTHQDFEKPFLDLLSACGQMQPSNFIEAFSKLCEPESIVKIGEGTYGEAFLAGPSVCKIVPIDGDFRVNGEIQKKADELLKEVVLSWTLNQIRECDFGAQNSCQTFIKTQDIKVCQGPYDPILIKAWEEWDAKHGSENDHPNFPEKQCYVMFVLDHGGEDLERFVLGNFDEARSLLVQVTVGLAVSEAAYEFEHRDLHWGNILLNRNHSSTIPSILEGKQIFIKTFGVQISIIDFTLSRINRDDKILFLDLSSDPYLFKGPKGDKQAETYRKMKAVTNDNWEGSFARTNVLWLIYLVDLLLTKKSFERSIKQKKELRSLKKRMEKYKSAKEAVSDPFFSDMLMDQIS